MISSIQVVLTEKRKILIARLINKIVRTAARSSLNLNSLYNFLTKGFKNKKLPL